MAKMPAMMDEEINKGYCDLPRAPGRWSPPYRSSAGTSGADAQAAATCQGRPREVVLLDTANGVLRPVRPHRLALRASWADRMSRDEPNKSSCSPV